MGFCVQFPEPILGHLKLHFQQYVLPHCDQAAAPAPAVHSPFVCCVVGRQLYVLLDADVLQTGDVLGMHIRREMSRHSGGSLRPPLPHKPPHAGSHTDYGMLTLLRTDDVPGLQIHVGGRWLDVPPLPGCFIVNLGDMLERCGPLRMPGWKLLSRHERTTHASGSDVLHCWPAPWRGMASGERGLGPARPSYDLPYM
jgi:hypothetical protein